jgi:hypothetical protein
MAEVEIMLRRVCSGKNEPVEETKCRRDEENQDKFTKCDGIRMTSPVRGPTNTRDHEKDRVMGFEWHPL